MALMTPCTFLLVKSTIKALISWGLYQFIILCQGRLRYGMHVLFQFECMGMIQSYRGIYPCAGVIWLGIFDLHAMQIDREYLVGNLPTDDILETFVLKAQLYSPILAEGIPHLTLAQSCGQTGQVYPGPDRIDGVVYGSIRANGLILCFGISQQHFCLPEINVVGPTQSCCRTVLRI